MRDRRRIRTPKGYRDAMCAWRLPLGSFDSVLSVSEIGVALKSNSEND